MDRSTNQKSEARLFAPCLDTQVTCECGGELTMPDYFPEIKRVISVSAAALPDSKYIKDSTLEVGGTLAFNLLYIGDDGTVCSAPYVTEYTHNVPIGKELSLSSSDIRVISSVESSSCRPLAPRTVSMKAKIKTKAFCDAPEDCTLKLVSGDKPIPSSAFEKYESTLTKVNRRSFSATGSVSGEKECSEGIKPVCCDGVICIEGTSPSQNAVTVKGEAQISCLVLTDEGLYKTVVCSLPFEERITADGTTPDCRTAAHGRVASVTASAENDSQVLSVDVEYDIDAAVCSETDVSVTDDIYSTDYSVEVTRKKLNALSLVCLENGSVSVLGEGRRKSQRGDGDYIIFSDARASFERLDIRDGAAILSGSCNFRVVIASGGDAVIEEFSVPVKYECTAKECNSSQNVTWNAVASVCRAECRLEDSRLHGSCMLNVFLEASKETQLMPVVHGEAVPSEQGDKSASILRVCYPEKGQRIWNVFKTYCADASRCEQINKVSRYDISDGAPLIIK